jgi:hypothetical protein
MSTFTPNKNIQLPASGSFTNAWAAPINENFLEIDTCLGGVTNISVTGVTGPSVTLTLSQYQPPNIEFSGTLSTNLLYYIPTGVGGIWSIENNTSGAFVLSIACFGTAAIVLPQGLNSRTLIICDGNGVQLADNATAAAAQAAAEAFATSAANTAQSNAEAVAANASNLTSGTVALARLPALPASQITSGTIANARLPNVFAGPGVTIASDPGTTPTGTFGQVFAYY